jgi:hypothetical protein
VKFFHRGILADVIDFEATLPHKGYFFGQGGRGYSPLQQQNLYDYKVWLARQIRDEKMEGVFACLVYDRTPSVRTNWKVRNGIDIAECLTTVGPPFHVLSLGVTREHPKFIDRALLNSERAGLQGFPRWYVNNTGENRATLKALGNAMSVPVVFSVLAREVIFDRGLVFPDLSDAAMRQSRLPNR